MDWVGLPGLPLVWRARRKCGAGGYVPGAARKELFEQLASDVAVGCAGRAANLASAIMFLTTNTFVTSSILDCDGGWKLKNT